MTQSSAYSLVKLASGVWSVHSAREDETFHPVIGPAAEADALYVSQMDLESRFVTRTDREFVVWDIGLGAAANSIAVIRALSNLPGRLRLLSFDYTLEPLAFALRYTDDLGYFNELLDPCQQLLDNNRAHFTADKASVDWTFHQADFPPFIQSTTAASLPKPDAILFDAFSPATNPEMWTLTLFQNLFQQLDPSRSCNLATYSRSTLLRVTLLLAGFYVGAGNATGEKEETTVAANSPSLLKRPLDKAWLGRARRSTSAEPLHEPVYRQAPLSPASLARLESHPQFN